MKPSIIKLIIFDIDGTLVVAPDFYKKYSILIEKIISQKLKISLKKAKEVANYFRKKFGRGEMALKSSKIGKITGINFKGNIGTNSLYKGILNINPENYLKPDKKINLFLKNLYQQQKILIALTNAPIKQAYKIFKAKGINKNYFKEIVGWQERKNMPKNSLGFIYKRIIKKYKLKPEEILTVGDVYETDIKPAIKLGIKGVLITNKNYKTKIIKVTSVYEILHLM